MAKSYPSKSEGRNPQLGRTEKMRTDNMDNDLKNKWLPLAKHTLMFFLPLMFLIICMTMFFYLKETNSKQAVLKSNENNTILLLKKIIDSDLDIAATHLLTIVNSQNVKRFIENDNRDSRRDLGEEFLSYVIKTRLYDAIRFLDDTGMELIRVNDNNGKPEIVSEMQLQNKGKRYYVKDTLALDYGEFFVSPFDLNMEQDRIELPLKPMIRLGTPIVDSRGKKRGILLLNYFGSNILRHVEQTSEKNTGRIMLLNKDGFWLKGPTPEDEWGFMYENRKNRTLDNANPEAWKHISSTDSGQFRSPGGGLFTFITVYPLKEVISSSFNPDKTIESSSYYLLSNDYYWKVVSHIPPEVLELQAQTLVNQLLQFIIVIGMIMLLGSFLFARAILGRKQVQQQLQQSYNELEIRVEERTKELFHANDLLVKEVDAHKRAETAIKESESKIQAILDTAVDGILTINHRGIVQSFNPAAERLFGYPAAEVIGNNITMLQPEPYSNEHDQYLRNYLTTGVKKIIGIGREVEGKRKDSSTFPMELAVSEVKVGNIQLFTGIVRDISERKQAEQDLLHAKEKAETADRAKSEFLATMSHEIRTPMNAIIGMADLLWETELTPEQQEYVQIFRNAGNNLLGIINDILDISKVEAGRLELEHISFDLQETIEKTCDIMALKAHEKQLELLCHIDPVIPPYLIGDPVRLRQILVNLIGNSIKFTEQGEVALLVSCSREDVPHDLIELLFSVSDTGIGIPAEKQAMVFESFSQADSSTTRKFGGTGLGLTICRNLVQMMDGRIWVESSEGEGATFLFTARFTVDRNTEQPARHLSHEMRLAGLHVLVVDDNDTNRLILRQVLSSWGMEVFEAANGEQGLAELHRAADARPFDLVLLDCRMPEMDGFTVAEKIKTEFPDSIMPVMMLTSDNRSGDITRAKQLGMAGYLVKPVKKTELKNAIQDTLLAGRTGPPKAGTTEINGEAGGPEGRSLTILLVEDTEDNRLLIKSYLKKTSHELILAENGAEGFEKFKQGNIDLVLMDMQMPVMDGYDATRAIREFEEKDGLKYTPVIALTAYAMKEDVDKSLAAGCDEHLTKPIRKKILLQKIAEYEGEKNHG